MYLFHVASAMLAEILLIHLSGVVFHPVFVVLATALAALYGLTASYGFAIVAVTIVIMALLMPLTISSTRSMDAMQRLQPKIRFLQQKYKGVENGAQMNQEMMQLYKEEGINPVGGCLPSLLPMPILVVLYEVIKGLNNTLITMVQGHRVSVAQPRYIPTSSRMYHDLVASHGAMNWLGIDLALKPVSLHAQWFGLLPYLALVLVAVGLQYVQLAQMRKRDPAAAGANPQAHRVQTFLPLVYAGIYLLIPGAVVLCTIVSTMIRVATQYILLRNGKDEPPSPVRAGPVP